MENETRKIRRAGIQIILVLVLALLLPQLIGTTEVTEQESGKGYTSPESLNGENFVCPTGSVYPDLITRSFPDSEILYVTDWADMCLSVAQGKAAAFIMEDSSLDEILGEYPELVAMPESIGDMEVSWAAAKTEKGEEIIRAFNEYLQVIKEDGTFDELYEKWTDTENAPDHIDAVPMTGEYKGTINVVTCLDWSPFTYQTGFEPCGLFNDLAVHFCAWAGYEPVFEYVDLQSALAGFTAGRYDLFSYGMVYSAERAEALLFSDAIYAEPLYAIIAEKNYAFADDGSGGEDEPEPASKAEEFLSSFRTSFEKNFIREDRWKMLLSGLGVTILLSVGAGILGTLLGAFVCWLRMSKNAYLTAFARIYIKLIQGMPIVVQLMILYYLVFADSDMTAFLVSIIGFSIDFSAYVSEIFRSGIETVPVGQRRAATALGFGKVKGFLKVVLPQALVHIIPVYSGQFISMVKMTSVAGYISVQDLTKISDIIRTRTYEAFFPLISTAVIYFIISSLLVSCLKILERRTNPLLRPRTIKGVKLHD